MLTPLCPSHSNFLPIVSSIWHQSYQSYSLFSVCKKLKALKSQFKKLNASCYGSISNKALEARKELCTVQQQLLSDAYAHSYKPRPDIV